MSLSEPRRLLKTGEEKVQHHFFLVSDHAQLEISVVYGIERLTEIRDAGDPAAIKAKNQVIFMQSLRTTKG